MASCIRKPISRKLLSLVPMEAKTIPTRARAIWSKDQRERFSTVKVNLGASAANGRAWYASAALTTMKRASGST